MTLSARIFLDSGAYGASNNGVPLDLVAYIQFVKRNQRLLERYLNLALLWQIIRGPGFPN